MATFQALEVIKIPLIIRHYYTQTDSTRRGNFMRSTLRSSLFFLALISDPVAAKGPVTPAADACPESYSWLSSIVDLPGRSTLAISDFELTHSGIEPLDYQILCRVDGTPKEQADLLKAAKTGIQLTTYNSSEPSYVEQMLRLILLENPSFRFSPTGLDVNGQYDATFRYLEQSVVYSNVAPLLVNHELLHAFDASQIRSTCRSELAMQPFPVGQKAVYVELMKIIERRVARFEMLIALVQAKKASEAEKAEYHEYLAASEPLSDSMSPYVQQFNGSFEKTISGVPEDRINFLQQHLGKIFSESKFNKMIGLDQKCELGTVQLRSAQDRKITLQVINPLARVCVIYKTVKIKLTQNYPSELFFAEWAPHMFQFFPVSVVQKLFPELWSYQNKRISKGFELLERSVDPYALTKGRDDSLRLEAAIQRAETVLKTCKKLSAREEGEWRSFLFISKVMRGAFVTHESLTEEFTELFSKNKDNLQARAMLHLFLSIGSIRFGQFGVAVQSYRQLGSSQLLMGKLSPLHLFMYSYAMLHSISRPTAVVAQQLAQLSLLACQKVQASTGSEVPEILREAGVCERLLAPKF